MRRARYLRLLGTREMHTGFWWGEMIEGDHLEDLDVDGWIILRWIFIKWVRRSWIGLLWLGIWTGGGLL
jgi:hypothetical protein